MYELKIYEKPKKKTKFKLLCLFKHKYKKEISDLDRIIYTCSRCKEEWKFMLLSDTSLDITKLLYENQTPKALMTYLIAQELAFNAMLNPLDSQSKTNENLFFTGGYTIFYLGEPSAGGIKEK